MCRKTVVIGAAAASILTLAGCASTATGVPRSSASAKPPVATSYRVMVDPEDEYHPGTNIINTDNPMYELIKSARKTLDITMFELDDQTATADLAADAARGVTVRVILDYSDANGTNGPANLDNNSQEVNTDTYDYLQAHHVHVVWASSAFESTQQMSVTADSSTSAIMTGGLRSDFAYEVDRDFTVIDTDPADVNAIETVFAADFAHRPVTPSDGDHLVWGPTDSQSQLLSLINGATKTLSVESTLIENSPVTSALISAAKRGVDVKTITTTDETGAPIRRLTDAGAHVRMYGGDDESPYIHGNVIIADGSRMFVGSQAFDEVLTSYRDLGFMTTDTALIATVSATITGDYSGNTRVHPTDG